MIIKYNLRLFENDENVAGGLKLLGVMEPITNREAMAQLCAEQFFEGDDLERWDHWFGLDSGDADVIVEFTEPAALAGHYRVQLNLSVRATNVEKIEWPKEKTA